MKTFNQIAAELLTRTREIVKSQGGELRSRQVAALAQAVSEQLAEIRNGVDGAIDDRIDERIGVELPEAALEGDLT